MAKIAPAYGSGRTARPDPIAQIGPAPAEGRGDPLTVMPEGCIDLAQPIVRIERARIISRGNAWQAVGLRLHSPDPASMLFEVFLTAGGGKVLVIAVLDEDEAVATWRGAARSMQLPLLLEAADGTASYPYPQIGAVALGQFHFRRQHSFLRHRRPRFLTRRKAIKPDLAKISVEGEEMSRGQVR